MTGLRFILFRVGFDKICQNQSLFLFFNDFLRKSHHTMGNQIPKTPGSSNILKTDKDGEIKEILVVNKRESNNHEVELLQERLRQLPPIIKPLVPIGQTTLNGHYPSLQSNILYDFGIKVEQELRLNADDVAREQNRLCDRIRDLDHSIGIASSSIVIERQRKFNKASENFTKFDEIDQIILRCEADIENILSSFTKLNEALPKSFQIEPFQL